MSEQMAIKTFQKADADGNGVITSDEASVLIGSLERALDAMEKARLGRGGAGAGASGGEPWSDDDWEGIVAPAAQRTKEMRAAAAAAGVAAAEREMALRL